jgi:hypothetical protein
MEKQWMSTIKVRFNEWYWNFFDELINVRLSNSWNDLGFIEKDRPMLWPRNGSYRIGNNLINDWLSSTSYILWDIVSVSGLQYQALSANTNSQPPSANWSLVVKWNADALFYTDRTRLRRHYRVFDKKLWYLNNNIWTSIKDLQTDSVKLQVQRIPMMLAGGVPVEYTTPNIATAAERVKKSASDSTPSWNIGKVLVITSWIYKWAFAPIVDYSTTDTEYTTGWAGIITKLPASITYRIFDTMADALQVCRWYENNSSFNDDLYFDGITELTHFKGYATSTLRQVLALTPTEWIKKSVQFINKVWSFSGSTLFYSGGLPGNPFFYDLTGALTLGGAGEIIDIIPFKNRLIIIWASYIYALNSTLTFDKLVESYGGIINWAISTGEDLYVLTTQRKLISIAETISWFLTLKNITQEVDNYVKEFKDNISTGFDGRYMYIYWEQGTIGTGRMVVLDLQYKFWSIYDWLPPRKIIAEWWLTYLYDNNTDIVRVLSSGHTDDVSLWTEKTSNVSQKITLKEIDLDDIFRMKNLSALYIAFENYSQQVQIDLFYSISRKNAKKASKSINIIQSPQWQATIGNNQVGNNMFWWEQWYSEISIPLLWKIDYNNDKANLFKISISGKDKSFFYISAIDIAIGFFWEKHSYFNPLNTI